MRLTKVLLTKIFLFIFSNHFLFCIPKVNSAENIKIIYSVFSRTIKVDSLKDFAELSTDEIIGGYDEIKGKREKFDGILEEFNLPKKDAEDLIMRARKKVFNI